MHYAKAGTGLIGGYSSVRLALSSARELITAKNKLRRKGVNTRNIRFLGFLNVRIKFL